MFGYIIKGFIVEMEKSAGKKQAIKNILRPIVETIKNNPIKSEMTIGGTVGAGLGAATGEKGNRKKRALTWGVVGGIPVVSVAHKILK